MQHDLRHAIRQLDSDQKDRLELEMLSSDKVQQLVQQRQLRRRRVRRTVATALLALSACCGWIWSSRTARLDIASTDTSKVPAAAVPVEDVRITSFAVSSSEIQATLMAESQHLVAEIETLVEESRQLRKRIALRMPLESAAAHAVSAARVRMELGVDDQQVRRQLETLRDTFPGTSGAASAERLLAGL